MRIDLELCPFCGGEFELVARDGGDNQMIIDNDYIEDTPSILVSEDHEFGIQHRFFWHPNCPISLSEGKVLGDCWYESIEEALRYINKRFTPPDKTT